MTTSAATSEFQQAATEWQGRQHRPDLTDGRLTITFGPKKMPTLELLHQKLYVLVRFGYLSAEQAETLYRALSSGSFVTLPPIPFPGAATGSVTLYDLFRVSLENRLEGVDDVVDFIVGIGHAIVVIAQTVEAVGDAVSDFWHWLTS